MRALIDGDILVYRIGFTTNDESEHIAQWRIDELVKSIIWSVGADDYKLYLSDSTGNNFRIRYYPEYKANRREAAKPTHYDFLRRYLVEGWEASITPEQEADDAIGINQTDDTIAVTIDKDLDQIPGKHYNFVKGLIYDVTEAEGLRWFYTQLVAGDVTENIPGVRGIGPAKAAKLFEGAETEEALFEKTYEAYFKWLNDKDQALNKMLVNGICLKIRRNEDEVWTFPKCVTSKYVPPQLTELQ